MAVFSSAVCCTPYHLGLLCLGTFDNSYGYDHGVADGKGIAAVPVLLHWAGWDSRVSSSQRNCDLWMSPHMRTFTSNQLWSWITVLSRCKDILQCPSLCIRPWQNTSNHLWLMDKTTSEQVHFQGVVANGQEEGWGEKFIAMLHPMAWSKRTSSGDCNGCAFKLS